MPEFLTTPFALGFAFFLALIGLFLAITADHLQVIAKYTGSQNDRVASGYNLAMKVMVVNRFGAVIYFLLIAFNIDYGISPKTLILGLSATIAFILLPTIGTLVWLQRRFQANDLQFSVLDFRKWPKVIVIATLLATSLNILGLTVPWIASASHPELRLTLANTSFLFNTLFTIVNVFYIEDKLAKLVDSKTDNIHGFVSGVIAARLFAYMGVSLALFLLI